MNFDRRIQLLTWIGFAALLGITLLVVLIPQPTVRYVLGSVGIAIFGMTMVAHSTRTFYMQQRTKAQSVVMWLDFGIGILAVATGFALLWLALQQA